MLVFEKCKVSGQMFANGFKNQYWIEKGAWAHMSVLSIEKSGPVVKRMGAYCSIEDAIKEAAVIEDQKIKFD